MKKLIGEIVILAFLTLPLLASTEPIKAKIIIFQNSRGKVTLTHSEHSELKGVKCIACHHRYIRAKPAACSRCHPRTDAQKEEKYSSIMRKDALHKCCLTCHKMTSETSSEKPPVACGGCHESEDTSTTSK